MTHRTPPTDRRRPADAPAPVVDDVDADEDDTDLDDEDREERESTEFAAPAMFEPVIRTGGAPTAWSSW